MHRSVKSRLMIHLADNARDAVDGVVDESEQKYMYANLSHTTARIHGRVRAQIRNEFTWD